MTDEAWNLLREGTAAGETTGALEHDLDTDHPDGSIEAVSGGMFCTMAYHGNVNTVAACSGQYFSHADARRLVAVWNACLGIADPSAVPDLLKGCRLALQFIDDGSDGDNLNPAVIARKQIAAAIRKATPKDTP